MKKINSWAVGTPAGVVLLGIISCFIYDYIKNKPLLSSITGFYNSVSGFFIGFVHIDIRLWIALTAIAAYAILKKIIKNLLASPPLPDFIAYKKDVFHFWIWRWDYEFVNGSWMAKDLTPYCPECDVELSLGQNIYRTWATCPKKKNSFEQSNNQYESADDVEKLIRAKINKMEYPK